MQIRHWARRLWLGGVTCALLLGAFSLGNTNRPALAATAPTIASCSNHYFYVMVASATPTAVSFDGTLTVGYVEASLWQKEYIDTKLQVVDCHQYHVFTRACAALGLTLPAFPLAAYVANDATGVVGIGKHVATEDALTDGACDQGVTSYDSLPTDTPRNAVVRGIGNYAYDSLALTSEYQADN